MLPVHAVFSCVQTGVRLPVVGILNVRTGADLSDCTWELHRHHRREEKCLAAPSNRTRGGVVTPCGWRKASKKSRNTLWVRKASKKSGNACGWRMASKKSRNTLWVRKASKKSRNTLWVRKASKKSRNALWVRKASKKSRNACGWRMASKKSCNTLWVA